MSCKAITENGSEPLNEIPLIADEGQEHQKQL
jgi:hypothetical protein